MGSLLLEGANERHALVRPAATRHGTGEAVPHSSVPPFLARPAGAGRHRNDPPATGRSGVPPVSSHAGAPRSAQARRQSTCTRTPPSRIRLGAGQRRATAWRRSSSCASVACASTLSRRRTRSTASPSPAAGSPADPARPPRASPGRGGQSSSPAPPATPRRPYSCSAQPGRQDASSRWGSPSVPPRSSSSSMVKVGNVADELPAARRPDPLGLDGERHPLLL